MEFKRLIPDLNTLRHTDWSKPQFDTKNLLFWASMGMVTLMVIFTLLPWFGTYATLFRESEATTRLGITTWYGLVALISALLTGGATLYKQYGIAFFTSALGVVMGLIGLVCYTSLTNGGDTLDVEEVRRSIHLVKGLGGTVKIIRIGAVLYTLAALLSAGISLLSAIGYDIRIGKR